MEPAVIIIRGPLGVGKTTVAQHVAGALRAYYVAIDDVLERHGLDKVPPDAACIPAANFVRANELVLPEVRKRLSRGQSVVFDACFYHREPIEHLRRSLQYPFTVCTLKAPVELCCARDAARAKVHGEDAARAVHSLVSRFDEGHVIDATGTVDETVKHLFASAKWQTEAKG